MFSLARTPLDLPLALFLVSALIGVWASYDSANSWSRFGLIILAVAIYYLVVWSSSTRIIGSLADWQIGSLSSWIVWLLLIGSVTLAVYFVTQHDYSSGPYKFEPIVQVGLLVNGLSPQVPAPRLHPNNAAGILEIGVPVGFALALHSVRVRAWTKFALAAVLTLIICLGVLMTASRGAWLAIGAVAFGAALIRFRPRDYAPFLLPASLIVLSSLVIGALRFGDLTGFQAGSPWARLLGQNYDTPRVELYRQVWNLMRDYTFTGAGLGTFPMVYSTYALLIDVPYIPHAQNLFLQIWFEQGLLGIAAFVWLVLAFYVWAWRRRNQLNWLTKGGVAATTVMLLHGLTDAPFWYSKWSLLLLFMPIALAIGGQSSVRRGKEPKAGKSRSLLGSRPSPYARSQAWAIIHYTLPTIAVSAVLLAALGSMLALGWRQVAARWYANLGSVAETRVELGGTAFLIIWWNIREENANCELLEFTLIRRCIWTTGM